MIKNLTTLLLTLLILGGCSNELDRCIKANIVVDEKIPSFNLGWIIADLQYRSDFDACLSKDPVAMEYRSQRTEISRQKRQKEISGITDKEAKDLEEQGKKIDSRYLSGLKRSWKNCEDIYKRKAEKICNSQGIY